MEEGDSKQQAPIVGGEKTEKQKAKDEAKRLKLEKFKQKQQQQQAVGGKSASKDKESAVEKLAKLADQLVLEDVPMGQMKNVTSELANSYIPRQVEHSWYSYWEKGGLFKPEYEQLEAKLKGDTKKLAKDSFTIVIPPPNITGTLHIGHALTIAIQDCLVRWNRMRGLRTLWLPGSDHAGIATQVVVEKKLQREQNKTRHDLGREAFLKEVWKWKQEKGDFIYDQLRRMGCSLDWDRTVFTLDPKMVKAVNEAFKRLFKAGYITRNRRLVNWSCKLKSAISDIEVDHDELTDRKTLQVPGYEKRIEFGIIETFAYEIYDETKTQIEDKIWVSTTRLETMLGDSAIAVHPSDERYKHLVGRFVKHPFCDRQLKVIQDEKVDPEFGTGAVKITPAHDFEDYEKGLRHNLEFIDIFTDDGMIVEGYGEFSGMKRFDARFAIRAKLRELGLLVEEKPKSNPMKVPLCSRSKDIVEPRVKEQWFMDCEEFARKARAASDSGELKIPKSHINRWNKWMDPESIKRHPWCISRQLWWGHRIPAYKASIRGQSKTTWVSGVDLEDAKQEAMKELNVTDAEQIILEQDEDVLDTWFSSGLFPFSVFGWPDKTPDFEKFYPNDLLETGEDIIFFWVARMVMFGIALTDKLPFSEVYLHSIVRDAEGRKMSKSLGNVIDPLDVISGVTLDDLNSKLKDSNLDQKEYDRALVGQKKLFPNGIPECGTDALRFKLCEYCTGSGDIHLRIDQLVGDRLLCNKIWQACKFAFITLGDNFKFSSKKLANISKSNEQLSSIISKLKLAIIESNEGFAGYNFRRATVACRTFWREELCSIYIEYIKKVKKEEEEGAQETLEEAKQVLYFCLDFGLRLLHPLMPYITEELYQRLVVKFSEEPSDRVPSICVARYPQVEHVDELIKF